MVSELVRIAVRCDQFAPRNVREELAQLPDVGWVMGDAMLIASELVTNAVKHSAASPNDQITVSVSRERGCLRISVCDPGASGTVAAPSEPTDLGGLGLRIVEHLSIRWGEERHSDGYEVWAELELPA